MPYRDERRCHICGALTRISCPRCSNPVCSEHTLSFLAQGSSAAKLEAAQRLSMRLGGMDACQSCVEKEIAASQGPFVTILRSSNPIEVQMIVEALRNDGFDARALGTQNAAMLGAGPSILEQRVEVPEPQAEDALAVIADLEMELPELDEEDFEDQEDEDDE